jgi:hypothetical protein
MERRTRSAISGGTILILLGIFILVARIVPDAFGGFSWPFIVMGVGAVFLIMAIVTLTPGLAIPAFIIGGIGAILHWQNVTHRWDTWAYAWTLIPGFVGVGILFSGLLEGRPAKALVEGGWPILISIFLFLLFGSFFGQIPWLGQYWGVFLIVIGVLVILRPLVRIGRKKEGD